MSTIEERLSRDIEAVTGEIVVTESDLRDARVAVEDRIEGGRQRDRRRGLVAAAAVAAVVVGVTTWQGLTGDDASPSPAKPGPSPEALSDRDQEFLTGDPVTAEVLTGVWRLDNAHHMFRFSSDGRFSYDSTGRLVADPQLDGTFAVDGDTITLSIEGGTTDCAGQTLTVRAVLALPGPTDGPQSTSLRPLHGVPVGPGANSCGSPFSPQWVLEHVLPADDFSWLKSGPGRNWDPVSGYGAMQGTWWDPQGGYLVELVDDGSYATLGETGELTDRGTWTFDASVTGLSMVSSADSPTCRVGDLFVLTSLRAKDFGVLNLQGDLERNDCDVAWKGTAWFKLAP